MVKNELKHYGVLGMKWGVRRYQNYDGSYTQKGMEHYRDSLNKYNSAKSNYKIKRKQNKEKLANKNDVRQAKNELRLAKRNLNRDYKQLAKDKAGDKGKKLYQDGKTITGNYTKLQIASSIAAGTAFAAKLLQQNGRSDYTKYAIAVGVGLEAVTGFLAINGAIQARYLRAYYGHSRNRKR